MFDHFTFAASARPDDAENSIPTTYSPRDTSLPSPSSPSPISLSLCSSSPVAAAKQGPVMDLTDQMSGQTITYSACNNQRVVEPTYLYNYDYGLPSPSNNSSSHSHSSSSSSRNNSKDEEMGMQEDVNAFPVVDDDTSASWIPISLSGLVYRSTVYGSRPSGCHAWNARRAQRQAGTRLLCSSRGKLERLVEGLDSTINANSNTYTATHIISTSSTSGPSTSSTNITYSSSISQQTTEQIPQLDSQLDEGFHEPSDPTSSADEEEAIRAFTMRRASGPSGIHKWRDVELGVRHGTIYRDANLNSNKVLSRPRMRRKISRRKREGDQEVVGT